MIRHVLMKVDDFDTLLLKLKASDEESWLIIQSHIEILITSWARREKIELDWFASSERMTESRIIPSKVYTWFREGVCSGQIEPTTYSEYKGIILKYTKLTVIGGFACFYTLIVNKSNMAWQRVYEKLYLYAAKWLSDRHIESDTAIDIYQESVIRLYRKVTTMDLIFENSREFKSYYFRILDLHTRESRREMILHKKRFSETDWSHLVQSISKTGFDTDDKYYYIERIMAHSMTEEEQFILEGYYFQGKKLSDIAKSLTISDGNCRQKKLQALRKIASIYKEIETMQMQNKT